MDFNEEQFYEMMAKCDEIPKTSQITPFEFTEIYLRQAQAGGGNRSDTRVDKLERLEYI